MAVYRAHSSSSPPHANSAKTCAQTKVEFRSLFVSSLDPVVRLRYYRESCLKHVMALRPVQFSCNSVEGIFRDVATYVDFFGRHFRSTYFVALFHMYSSEFRADHFYRLFGRFFSPGIFLKFSGNCCSGGLLYTPPRGYLVDGSPRVSHK